MHQAALIGHALADAPNFGWQVDVDVQHSWEKMKDAIQEHIKSLNWSYKVQLRVKNVTYLNAYATFDDAHHITATDAKGKETKLSSKYFILATGGRPRYPPELPGCKEFCVSSDDLFSLPRSPGKTLVVGASYVALECAGFLRAFGLDVTVMVRSILLRGFDQQMAELIGTYMQNHGVSFVRPCVPTKIERVREEVEGQPAVYKVTGRQADGSEFTGEYNTILMAVGRDPCTTGLGLSKAGVKVNPKTGYVVCGDDESTSSPSVYAVGDIIEGRPELTPVAIHAGQLLTRRLFAGASLKCDYNNVPTTVFTPLEYGCIGLAEEDATAKYTADDIQVYHSTFTPLEWTVPHRETNACYAKLICVKSLNERVVGLHVLGPNAGEMTQGWTVGLKLGATKTDFDNTIGIHPTCAEVFTTLTVTKASGDDSLATGC
jgi:thioredoxin reductase (NADPH)